MVARLYPALRFLGGFFGMCLCGEGHWVSKTMFGGLLLSFLASWSWFGITMKEESKPRDYVTCKYYVDKSQTAIFAYAGSITLILHRNGR